jgi:predicted transcriptional regulator
MSFITIGNALGCTINSHRRGWDGSICKNAETWNCSAKQQFRTDYCQQGDPRCYHIHIFEEGNPFCLIDDLGIGWLLEPYPEALNNQILLFWGKRFQEPRGISDINTRPKDYVFGAYRVRSVYPQKINEFKTLWKIEPYPDGWTRFQQPYILTVYYKSIIGGVYLKEVNRVAVENMFEKAAEQASSPHPNWFTPKDAERFTHFHANLHEWFEAARDDALKLQQTMVHPYTKPLPLISAVKNPQLFDGLKNLDIKKTISPASIVALTPKPTPTITKNGVPAYPLLEKDATKDKIKTIYSKETLDALMVASLTKNIVILTGHPGVGKSSLAIDLIEDTERKLIVAVGSTWRGREDLLGYVNPISSEFEPTDFTRFLCKAEMGWRKNDKRTHLVIFEEFNLSQPEYWFADMLVRSQYPDDQEKLRTIELGGKCIRGITTNTSRVFVSPALRFVATINNDHTTLSLSPRVLDRASIIELTLEPRYTLERAKLELDEKQIMSIEELDALLKYKNALFSLRAAESLKRCIDNLHILDMNSTWDALDIILLQQVLTKVRLMVGDPANDSLMQGLEDWSENYGKYLRKCATLIDGWTEALKDGRDVIQA